MEDLASYYHKQAENLRVMASSKQILKYDIFNEIERLAPVDLTKYMNEKIIIII
jgi:hypothetical protein